MSSIQQKILESQVQELLERHELLTKKLNGLTNQRDLETRVEEQMRLDKIISEAKSDRDGVDKELQKLERKMNRASGSKGSSKIDIQPQADAVTVFYSYAHEDEKLRDKLNTHLKILERQKVIDSWHDRDILPGSEWADEIDENLEAAQIILLLISADFIASDYCWGKELERAMERHEDGDARVIPIILRSCDWSSAPFGKLQALPKNAKPVTSFKDQDQAFTDIAQGIRRVAEDLRKK